MRKSFRHELIMLLIQSDFVKSAAFVIFPIVSLTHGPIDSNSAFCQISGFGLALGIESSDIAVLLIALHSVMYIFRPRSGLYPYRRYAYAVYYLFPLVTASLAFIDGPGYENLGHYCYLRANRGWRRMALSWIPRYVVLIALVAIYAFIYIYIRKRMDDYGRRSSCGALEQRKKAGIPPLPRISYHGLLPSSPTSRRPSAAESSISVKGRQESTSSLGSVWTGKTDAKNPKVTTEAASQPGQHLDWNWAGFRQPRSSAENPFPDETEDPLSQSPNPVVSPPPPVHSPKAPRDNGADDHSDASSVGIPQSSGYFWRRPVSLSGLHTPGADHAPARRPNVSLPNIITMLRRGPPTPPAHDTRTHWRRPHQQVSTTASRRRRDGPTSTATSGSGTPILTSAPFSLFESNSLVTRNRSKVRRQLRSLFVYPLVYIIIWVFPFVSHIMGYDDAIRPDDPMWLLILGIISLSVQGTVDCALFAAREKPWRHAATGVGMGFWDGLGHKLTLTRDGAQASGRTREEMMVDGRLARERRGEEVVVERSQKSSAGQGAEQRSVRYWWDVEERGWDWANDDGLEEQPTKGNVENDGVSYSKK
ncbi:hypothetical protein OQA88_2324 [Cercophora sp. LCS_1]